jgi:hypothetical protein
VRVLSDHIDRLIGKAAGAYKLEGAAELAKAAIVELTKLEDPEHLLIVYDEDMDGNEMGGFSSGGDLAFYVSLPRLATVETTLADIVKKARKAEDPGNSP